MPAANADLHYIVNQHDPYVPFLPAVHITSVSNLTDILYYRLLKVDSCPVFNHPLIYFFYGKPTYQIKPRQPGATKILSDAGICICLRLDAIKAVLHKIFCFDTGGCHGERYDQYLPSSSITVDDFELPGPSIDIPARYVNAFYGSNKEYYEGSIKRNLQILPMDKISEVIINLGNSTASQLFDERVASAEIQVSGDVVLDRNSVEAIVAPSRLKADTRFTDACADFGITPTYYIFKRATPEARTEVIYERLGEYLEQKGYFK